MDDRIKQIIGRYKNKVSVDEDTNLNVTLDTTTRVVKTNANPINYIIGVDDQFELERNVSAVYRILGRLNIITANELTQGTADGTIRGTDDIDWDPLFTEFLSNGNVVRAPNNWVLQVCYPSFKDDRYNLWGDTSTFKPVSLGMKVLSLSSNNPSGNRSLLVVETLQKHKLSEGDYIHLNDRNLPNQYQGIHKVFELGSNGGDLETKITLETSWKGDYTNEMFLNRVANSSDNDVNFNNSDTITSLVSTDITGGTTNSNYIKVTTSNEHGLGINGFIEVRHNTAGTFNGFHRVHHVIDDFNFTIRLVDTLPSPVNYRYRRMDGTPSEYYVREFELLTSNDYDTYPTAFSSNVYPKTSVPEFGISNGTWSFHLTKDVNTGNLISHRGGIVNELKVCMLKRAGENPYNWSNVTSHWEFDSLNANTLNAIETVSGNFGGGVGSILKNTPKTLTNTGSKYIGDIVEYNRKEITEKIISEVIFRFGVESGVINNNNIPENPQLVTGIETETTGPVSGKQLRDLEGYYYKPFKTIEILKYSKQIEKAEPDELIDGVPNDYETYPDGSLAWRDLLTPGFIEEGDNGVDWPFVNGRHHIYINNHIFVRRQNPYVVIDQSGIITVNPKNAC